MLNVACENHQNARRKIAQWFEPFFRSVDSFVPAATVAVQAWPNPGSLVLGGIVGVVQITKQYTDYQRRTLQTLARMGSKAEMLLDYETSVYRSSIAVQKALIEVHGSIIAFCVKAFRFVKSGRTRIRGMSLAMFRSYESRFGEIEQKFEAHLETLQDRAASVDRERLLDVHQSRDTQHKLMKQTLEQIGEIRAGMSKRDDVMRRQDERR